MNNKLANDSKLCFSRDLLNVGWYVVWNLEFSVKDLFTYMNLCIELKRRAQAIANTSLLHANCDLPACQVTAFVFVFKIYF